MHTLSTTIPAMITLIILASTQSKADIPKSERLRIFNLETKGGQSYTNFLAHLSIWFQVDWKADNDNSQELLPKEMLETVRDIDFSDLEYAAAFGNPREFTEHPVYGVAHQGFELPFAGTTMWAQCGGRFQDYFKLVKMLGGFFHSEVKRPMKDYFVIPDSGSKRYFEVDIDSGRCGCDSFGFIYYILKYMRLRLIKFGYMDFHLFFIYFFP